jgi:hypothetical protein
MVVDDSVIERAIETFAPVYIFHPQEKYLPLRFETFVRGCSLMRRGASASVPSVVVRSFPNLTLESLTDSSVDADLDVSRGPTNQLFLQIEDSNMMYGTPLTSSAPAVHYVYASTVEVDGGTGGTFIDLLFNLLYGFNCMSGDDHEFDSEYVIVRVHVSVADNDAASSLQFISMWTSRHGGGMWVSKQDLQFVNDTHPVSYVALGSHANYVSPGVQHRLWNFGNDFCSDVKHPTPASPFFFAPQSIRVSKPTDPGFPAPTSYMAFTGLTSRVGSRLLTWSPRYLNSIQTPPPKASDDTTVFIKKQVPGIGNFVLLGVVILLCLALCSEVVVLVRNTKSLRNATWQHSLLFAFTFSAGVFSTYAHLLM